MGNLILPSWYPLWHVSHKVIRVFGAFPPVFLDSIWCTFNLLSLDFPLQHWQVCSSRKSTYSRTFQKFNCSPCWYSFPWILGFFIFWISNEATSTIMFCIGNILYISAIHFKWQSILCLIEGANHPSFFEAIRLLKRGLR